MFGCAEIRVRKRLKLAIIGFKKFLEIFDFPIDKSAGIGYDISELNRG